MAISQILSASLASGVPASSNMPTGSVLQVVTATTTNSVGINTTSFATTGFSLSITPKFSTSKILVLLNAPIFANANGLQCYVTLYRNGSNIGGNGLAICYSGSTSTQTNTGINFIDSPATTSSVTYTPYMAVSSAGQTAYFCVANSLGASTGSMTLLEIAA